MVASWLLQSPDLGAAWLLLSQLLLLRVAPLGLRGLVGQVQQVPHAQCQHHGHQHHSSKHDGLHETGRGVVTLVNGLRQPL